MAGIFNNSIFNTIIFNTGDAGAVEEVVKTGTGGIDPGEGLKRRIPVKPTGLLHLPPKRGKQVPAVEERIEEAARERAEIAGRLAREFTEETRLLERPPIATMTMAEVEAEIGVLLRKKLRTEEEDILLLMLMAASVS